MTSSLAVLRDARETDVDALMVIEHAVFGSDAWSAEAMRRDVTSPHCRYIVAEIPGANVAVGYAGLLCPEGSEDADIQTVAVANDMRGRGLGRQMMVELIAEAKRRHARRLFLEVRADNPVAIGLYRDLGFVRTGVRRAYYQPDGVDAIMMRLDLVSASVKRSAQEEMEGAC